VKPSATKDPGCQQVETQLDAGSKESTHNPLAGPALADPIDRYRNLCDLLDRVTASGPIDFEPEIDRLREHINFTDAEREVVAKIFRRGFEAALQKGDQHKTWAYQRLLRRLLVGQPLDCPILGDNPYAMLSQPKDRLPGSSSEAQAIRGMFANEEGGNDRTLGELARGSAIKRSGSGPRRLFYAVAINLVAVLLWLGPLNTKIPDRANAQRHGETAPAVAIAEKSASAPPSSGTGELAIRMPLPIGERESDSKAPAREATAGGPGESRRVPEASAPATVVVSAVKTRPAKPAFPAPGTVLQAAHEIGLRSEPQHSAPKGEAIEPGARLVVIGEAGSWLKVRCEKDGSTGYVRREFVEPILPES